MLELLALFVRELGFVVYGGSLLAMTAIIIAAGAGHVPYLSKENAVRAYRAWGPGLGLSMGAMVLGGLLHHFLVNGAFSWPLDAPTTPAWIVFFVLWVSNLRLEVWTLDPIRKLDGANGVEDNEAFDGAVKTLIGHMVVQTVLVFAAHGLFYWAEHPIG